ncbi:MAG: hypothetical protein CSA18_04820 [Deltaproteobacteria bacterium]|nr:MAG: hypothetical protein CSA18_04820 [Deltaproteobacteria bacterium]
MLWKHKWKIFAFIIVATVLSVIISFMLPKIYYIDAIVQPGKNSDSNLSIAPQEIVQTIKNRIYDRNIAEVLTIPLDQMPEVNASILESTTLVNISLESSEPQLAKKIIKELLNNISASIQKEQDIVRKKIEIKIDEVLLDRNMLKTQVSEANKQLADSKFKINDLEKKKLEALKSPNRDSLITVLLYTNEIRNGQVYLNSLNDKVSGLENRYQKTTLMLEGLRLQLKNIKSIVINKEPTIQEKYVKPNKKVIVLAAFVGSFMVAVPLAFLLESVSNMAQKEVNIE